MRHDVLVRMIAQLWNTNTPVIISRDADLTENYMYISMKFRTGVHVFCWEVGAFNRSYFQSVSCKSVDDEEIMISWIQDQECIWNNRMTDYRDTKKKEALWQVKATDMGYTGKYNQIFDINLFSRYHNTYWLEI